MPFGVAAAAIGAGAAVYGASKQSKAVSKGADAAAEAQLQGQRESIEFQREALGQTLGFQREALGQLRGDLSPYTAAGGQALGGVGDLTGLNGAEGYQRALGAFQSSPGYRFQVDEGMRAVKASASAQGLSNSGATLKALQERGQQLANQDFGTYYNRLAGLAQMGQNSAAMVGTAGMQSAGQMGSATMGAANAMGGASLATGNALGQTYAGAATAQANITGGMVQGVGNALNSGLNSLYGAYRSNSLYNPWGGR